MVYTGCSGTLYKNDNIIYNIYNSDFYLRYTSKGGFGDAIVEINYRKDHIPSISVLVAIGNNPLLLKAYNSGDPIADIIAKVFKTRVFELPLENRKRNISGRDMAFVKMEYERGGIKKVIIRDYHWGEHFESSFHRAEGMFTDIAIISRKSNY
jgi:hypothetical protein